MSDYTGLLFTSVHCTKLPIAPYQTKIHNIISQDAFKVIPKNVSVKSLDMPEVNFRKFSALPSIAVTRRPHDVLRPLERIGADFITRIFTGMKLNANIEQIEGKLYSNIRGEILIEVGRVLVSNYHCLHQTSVDNATMCATSKNF